MQFKLCVARKSAKAVPAQYMHGLNTVRGSAGERVLLALPDGAVAAASKPTNATGAPSSGAAAHQATGSEASADPLTATGTAGASHAHLRYL